MVSGIDITVTWQYQSSFKPIPELFNPKNILSRYKNKNIGLKKQSSGGGLLKEMFLTMLKGKNHKSDWQQEFAKIEFWLPLIILLFTQSIKVSQFHCVIIMKFYNRIIKFIIKCRCLNIFWNIFIRKWIENGRLLLTTTFRAKCKLVFVLTQENA